MRTIKVFGVLASLFVTGAASAGTGYLCGSVECSITGAAPISEITDLSIGGSLFNVTFSETQSSTFQFSQDVATSGQSITGLDAANALAMLFESIPDPCQNCDGTAFEGIVDGSPKQIFLLYTAADSITTPGATNLNYVDAYLGGGYPGAPSYVPLTAGPQPSGTPDHPNVGAATLPNQFVKEFGTFAVFSPVSAPEISADAAPAALTLLLGFIAVIRGRQGIRRSIVHV